jgi:hypothetical protein
MTAIIEVQDADGETEVRFETGYGGASLTIGDVTIEMSEETFERLMREAEKWWTVEPEQACHGDTQGAR